jgi:hypothetical protein
MKYFKISLFASILTLAFLLSCSKEAQNSSKSAFLIKDIYGKEVNYLQPEILTSINKTLISEGRNEDAIKLHQLYDFKTGILKSANGKLTQQTLPTVVVIDSSKIKLGDTIINNQKSAWQPQGVFAYAHCQDYGNLGPFTQCAALYTINPVPFVGTTGKGKRLEAFTLQTDPSLFNTRPTVYYSLMLPNQTWFSYCTWGQETGSEGRSQATIGLKMWSITTGWHLYYVNHNSQVGWNNPWEYDGYPAYSVGHQLEAFAFQILNF